MAKALDIISDALMEIGALAQGEVASAGDANFGLTKLNRLLDAWQAQKKYIYSVGFTTYTLTPNHQPHLIGPGLSSPDFAATVRPVKISNAAIVLTNTTPNVYTPLNIRDDDWWANQRVRGLTSSFPTDLYYSPDWPNGSLWLWPAPTTAWGLSIEAWTILSQLANLATTFTLPPGYQDAVTYSLAESLMAPFGRPPDPLIISAAMKARAVIEGPNALSPRMTTKDSGIPTSGKPRPYFSYLVGS